MYRPSISIVICTYNRAVSLSDTLRGVSQLDYSNYEVIVVDGPSQDSTSTVLEAWSGRIKTVKCDVANLAVSRNLGIEASGGEIVSFIDDDAVPHTKWVSLLASKYADDRVGGVGGFTIDNTGRRFQSRKTLCDRFGNAHYVSAMFDERPLNRVGTPLYPSLLGTNSSFRRRALVEVGGFDHTFAYFLDETDVCLRIVDAGYQLLYEPSALVFHQFAPSDLRTSHRVKRTYYPIAVSKSYFIMRHGCAHSVEEAGRQLTAFREQVLAENESLVEGGAITDSHRVSLDQDLLRGISAGTEAAMATAPCTRGNLTMPAAANSFIRFPASQRMRIALVCQNFSPSQAAGIGRWTWMLAKGLTDRGHVVHVITRGDEEPSTQFTDGYWLHTVSDDPFAGEVVAIDKKIPNALASRAAAVRQAVRYVKSFGLDLMSFPIWDLEGIACMDEPDIAIAMSLHTTFGLAKSYTKEWSIRPLQEHFEVEPTIAAEHRLLEAVPTILANSTAIVNDLTRMSGVDLTAKATVIPHGTTDPFISNPLRRAMRTPDTKPVRLLYAGRFEARKGFDIAATVFDKLLQMGRDVEIDMIGDELSPRVVSWLTSLGATRLLGHPRVRLGGVVDRERLDDMLSSADIVLFPSRYESFGLVAIEAMAAGAPVVALRTGGLAEVIKEGISGRLVEADGREVQAILDVLIPMIGDSSLRRELSRGARETFQRLFTLDIMIDGVERALKSALEKKEKAVGT